VHEIRKYKGRYILKENLAKTIPVSCSILPLKKPFIKGEALSAPVINDMRHKTLNKRSLECFSA
jgi:hypothetical protein